ncbi:MAG: Uma2 family endonuclease [Prosthecobacter sp.]|uniref:Uma2 family endonuclease n=1 Tax=Prosthecobacter sp. TaxID=1965333 RepID=UPI0039002059
MSAFAELLAPIQSSPFLPELVDELSNLLALERQRRGKFYEEMTPEMKVEFIEGEVVLHSPARNAHLDVTYNIATLVGSYVRAKQLGEVKIEKCLCVFPRNDYEPDVVFFGKDKAAAFRQDTMKFPIPDLIVEVISECTEARDRGVKFQDYAAHGVQEYWIVDAEQRVLEQHVLVAGCYDLKMKSSSGTLISVAVPGFRTPLEAVFDSKANTSALRDLLE